MTKTNYLPTKLAGYVGFFVQAIVNNFLPILFIALQSVYKMSYARLASLIAVNFGAQVFVDFLAPRIVAKTGYRKAAFLSQFAAFLGLAFLSLLPNLMPPYAAIIVCILIYATGSGLTEVILSPMIEMLPTRNKSGNMALLHSFYCWGQAVTVLLTTALVYLSGFENWFVIPLIPFESGLIGNDAMTINIIKIIYDILLFFKYRIDRIPIIINSIIYAYIGKNVNFSLSTVVKYKSR